MFILYNAKELISVIREKLLRKCFKLLLAMELTAIWDTSNVETYQTKKLKYANACSKLFPITCLQNKLKQGSSGKVLDTINS